MQITSDEAEAMIRAAKGKAANIGIAVSIVILDMAGHPKAFLRMDDSWLGSVDVAMKKAKTSVLFQSATQDVWEVCKPGAQAHGLESTNGGLVTFAGWHTPEGHGRSVDRSHRSFRRSSRTGFRNCRCRCGGLASPLAFHWRGNRGTSDMSRKILITGAGSGLGEGAAVGMARNGHHVIAAALTWPQVTALRAKAGGAGPAVAARRKARSTGPLRCQPGLRLGFRYPGQQCRRRGRRPYCRNPD